jgi:hypothetical protein
MRLSISGSSDCGVVYDAGNNLASLGEFCFLLVIVPTISCTLSIAAAGRRPVAGLVVAGAIAALVLFVLLSGTAYMVQQEGSSGLCPSGVPPWWPWWLPR